MTSSGSGSKTSQILGTAVIYQTTKKNIIKRKYYITMNKNNTKINDYK